VSRTASPHGETNTGPQHISRRRQTDGSKKPEMRGSCVGVEVTGHSGERRVTRGGGCLFIPFHSRTG
jgi:hypothetical protein